MAISTKNKKSTTPEISKKTYLDWYKLMYRIRRFEERSLYAYSQQKIRGFLHVYIGQEATAAGISSVIKNEDALVTSYRQHGLALTKGLSSRSCMAELFGKETGCVKGKGGSMHFFSKEHNYFGGNGIVGAQIPIGTGIALAEKYRKTKNICVTMFGDGASRQGALHESFNMAMHWKLPVLFLCENNKYAMGTSVKRSSNVQDIHKLGLAFDMPNEAVDGMDPCAIHNAVEKAVKHIRSGKGPYFIEIKTYRFKGHSVSDPGRYRTKDELNDFKGRDPIKILKEKLLSEKIISQKEIDTIHQSVEEEMDDAVKFAEESNFPDPANLFEDNYIQADYPFIKD